MTVAGTFPHAPPTGASLDLEQVRALSEPVRGPRGDLPRTAQVIIIGGGPAGLTAANLLGSLGIQTLLLEMSEATAAQPKAIAIDDEYMRLLHRVRLGEAMAGHHSPPFGIWFMGADGVPVVKVAGAVTSNGFGRRSAVMQPVFEKILLAGALRYDCVSIRYARRACGVAQSAEGVEVVVDDTTLHADYLLACDGARSFVRSALGIAFNGSRIDQPHLVLDLADFPDQATFSRFFCNPARPVNSVPSVYGGRRIEIMLNASDDADEMLSEATIRQILDEQTPYRGVPLNIIRKTIYGFSERIAERLQIERVFLLGDAAHVMPPFGGQGMNTAARDANNLCWKIAAVLGGRANPSLLTSYDPERRPQITSIVDYSVKIGEVANIRSRTLARVRDIAFRMIQCVPSVRRFFSEMRYMPPPTIRRGLVVAGEKRFSRLIGRPFPRLLLETDGKELPIDDLVGQGFCLVGIGVAPSTLRAAARHPVWSGRDPVLLSIETLGPNEADDVRTLVLAAGMAMPVLLGTICVVRPDLYVAAIAPADRVGRCLDRLAAKIAL